MSIIKVNSIQLGQSATTANNFTLNVPATPDGTIKLSRGVPGALGADVLSVGGSHHLHKRDIFCFWVCNIWKFKFSLLCWRNFEACGLGYYILRRRLHRRPPHHQRRRQIYRQLHHACSRF